MKNFPILHENKEYWVSRAIAVIIEFTVLDNEGNEYVLAVQRGKGTPDLEFVGAWCLPCGYLDYNETIREAASRELKEETGIYVSPDYLKLININDNPNDDKRQNITFTFKCESYKNKQSLEKEITSKFSEKDEVSDIKFISVNEINKYKWAFNHDKLITELYG